ncbi:Glycosyltransferase [Methanosarcina siciliae C2J]|uniref:Glycosyltransferase n=2 Tax=Methanosarcina siciliae TaxID=38027 RepID=A0A0E3PPF1_9EURY|nr:Glycosyltransferase [Methanosarcina siciliae C2J]
MHKSSIHYRILNFKLLPQEIRKLMLILMNWVFQSVLYMDRTERTLKVLVTLIPTFILFFLFQNYYSELTSIIISFSIAHTLNWIFNGQIFVLLKNVGWVNTDKDKFFIYSSALKRRIEKTNFLYLAVIFGSLSRNRLTDSSDLDIRIIRKSGLNNALKCFLFIWHERLLALIYRFPLDIYILDDVSGLSKINSEEAPIILYDPDNYIVKNYTEYFFFQDIFHKSMDFPEIIMVYPYDPLHKNPGGGIKYVDNLIMGLLKEGKKVTLLGVKLSDKTIDEYQSLGFKFVPITEKSDASYLYLLFLFVKTPFLKLPINSVIHSHRSYFLLPFILFRQNNLKIVTLHGITLEIIRVSSYAYLYPIIEPVFRFIERLCLSNIDVYIAVSNNVKHFFENRYPWMMNRIEIIPTGVDLTTYKPMDKHKIRKLYGFEEDDLIVMFVGRLEKIKNIDFLIRSFTILSQQVSNSKLLIVGNGVEESNLKNISTHLGSKIFFMGSQPSEKMPEIYNLASVLALCSESEASPNVVKEALACGIPVVSTDVGDVSSIICNDSLGKISHKDENSFARDLIHMCKSKGKNKVFFEHRNQFVTENFEIKKMSESISKVLEYYL